jgi:ABC-type multidrug transport system ATPase subunit
MGHNGSGKTTLLRVAATLIRPSSGKLVFPSHSDEPREIRRRLSMVAHATMLYEEFTAEENLELTAQLYGLENSSRRISELLEHAGLAARRGSLVRTFSRGMRQRLAIARALLTEPSLLLLDEPGTGLDVQGAAWLTDTLGRLRDAGCTILMSLHGQSELAGIATRALRLEAGAVAADSAAGGTVQSVLASVVS